MESMIPPYGWVVSGAYFLGKYGMEELNIDFWNNDRLFIL